MSEAETAQVLVLAVLVVGILLIGGLALLMQRGGGDAELRGIRRERQANEREADAAALKTVEHVASANALRRHVRNIRRQQDAEMRAQQHQEALNSPTNVPAGAGAGGAPIPSSPPPLPNP